MDYPIISSKFILTKNEIGVSTHDLTNSLTLNHLYLYYDNRLKVFNGVFKNTTVIVLGYILDIRDSNLDEVKIAQNLAGVFEQDKIETFYEELSMMNGRYIIIVDSKDDSLIFTDATCLRPLYYYEDIIFGSHEVLIRNILEDCFDIKLDKVYTMNGYMDVTNTNNILKFNCNNFYSTKDAKFTRYYPLKVNRLKSVPEIFENTNKYFKEQTKWLDRRFSNITTSITGGADSRVTLSFLKPIIHKVNLFTYMIDFGKKPDGPGKTIYYNDKIIVDKLVENFSLQHKYYYLDNYIIDEKFKADYENNLSSKHSMQVAKMFREEIPNNSIHVKSTIYEMAKLPFVENRYDHYKKDHLYEATSNYIPKHMRDKDNITRPMFNDFVKRSNFNDFSNLKYNYLMMLYWETRMGNWHSNITSETDEHIETFVYINNRYMLDQFMSLTLESRKDKRMLSYYIEKNWQFLNYLPPNKLDSYISLPRNDIVIQSISTDLIINNLLNVDIKTVSDRTYLIKPRKGVLLKTDNISFQLKNETNKLKQIKLTTFYKDVHKNIKILKNNVPYTISAFNKGHTESLKPNATVSIEFDYASDFITDSWFEAGRILIEEIE